jgi:putative effector of murein hydrolase LrgA (UPF0299 family)
MALSFLVLVAFTVLGDVLADRLALPLPGPVIGLFLLAAALLLRPRRAAAEPVPAGLGRLCDRLIGHMGLLFVPAGVGAIAEAAVLRQQAFPILTAILGSTVIGLIVTGRVLQRLTRVRPVPPAGLGERA